MWPRGWPLEDGAAAVDGGHSDKREQRRQRVFALLITGEPGHLCIQDTGTVVSRWTVIKEYSRYAGLRTKNPDKVLWNCYSKPRLHVPLYTKMFLVSMLYSFVCT